MDSLPQDGLIGQMRLEREAEMQAKRQDRLAIRAEASIKLAGLLKDWLSLLNVEADGPTLETGEWRYGLIRRGIGQPEGLTIQRRYPPTMRVAVHSWIPQKVAWDGEQALRAIQAINAEYERAERISAQAG